MSVASGVLENALNMFVAPSRTFRNLKERPVIAFPLILLLAASIILWIWYYQTVDFRWLVDRLVKSSTSAVPPEQRAAVAAATSQLTPGLLTVISIITACGALLISSLVMSVYLLIVSVVRDDQIGFESWFSLVLWASLPSLVGVLAIAARLLLAPGHRVATDQVNPLSLGFFGLVTDARFKTLLGSLDLTSLCTWALVIVGYRLWTGRSLSQSAAVVLAPIIVIYACWAFMVAR